MGVILIAYERESEQAALEQMLGGRGHHVLKASNGLAALDLARREPPHLVVSDIVLPRMDGFALCRKWKQDERLQAVPFIFYTRRHDDPKYERFALELGAEGFIARTAQPEALASAIDQLLANVPVENGSDRAAALDEGVVQRAQAVAQQRVEQALMQAQQQAEQARIQALAQLKAEHEQAQAQALAKLQEEHAQALAQTQRDAEQSLANLKVEHERALERTQQVHEQALERSQQTLDRLRADVAELETSRERVAAGEARFRRVFEANPLPMWMADHATHGFIAVNDAALAMYGYTRAEFLALTTRDLEGQAPKGGENVAQDVAAHKSKSGQSLFVALAIEQIEFDGRSADLVCAYDLTSHIGHKPTHSQLDFLIELLKHSEDSDESAIVRHVVDQAALATDSPLSYLFFVDPAHKALTLAAWRDRAQPHVTMAAAEPRPLAGLFTECVKARHVTSSNDLNRKPQPDGLPDLQRFLAVPMIADERTVAILGVANRDAAYGEEDQATLSAMAQSVWRVLQPKRAHALTLSSLQRTDVALQAMIEAMLRTSERHDPYTAGSAHRLAALAVALAREAGLDGQRQNAIRVAALLHDIGNVAVPASILGKPGPLTEHEIALMRTHAEEGCKLLADIDFGSPVADIIFEHHERIDGSGYPRGIEGEDILVEARVLAIADTVEAMCSPRPYRPALGMEAALDEINKNAGKLYDLHLVSACTRLVRQRGFVLPD